MAMYTIYCLWVILSFLHVAADTKQTTETGDLGEEKGIM